MELHRTPVLPNPGPVMESPATKPPDFLKTQEKNQPINPLPENHTLTEHKYQKVPRFPKNTIFSPSYKWSFSFAICLATLICFPLLPFVLPVLIPCHDWHPSLGFYVGGYSNPIQ